MAHDKAWWDQRFVKKAERIYKIAQGYGESAIPVAMLANELKEVYEWGILDATLPVWGEPDVQVRSTKEKDGGASISGKDEAIDI